MPDRPRLKDDYTLARCCLPCPNESIVGYYSHDNYLKVHRQGCSNLEKAEPARLVDLEWPEILAPEEFTPGIDYGQLEASDFDILSHHFKYGIDYSLLVARKVGLSKQETFDRHRKLLRLGLLKRVDATMVRYRKGIVDHKWIKHRNHTYYDLTPRGRSYLRYYQQHRSD
jgi:hypothetical protein